MPAIDRSLSLSLSSLARCSCRATIAEGGQGGCRESARVGIELQSKNVNVCLRFELKVQRDNEELPLMNDDFLLKNGRLLH